MPKKPIANHFADWMKRIGVRLRDLESNHEELKSQLEELEELIRSLRSSARKWMILRVSWRLRTPASMISRAKPCSLKNHRRTTREPRRVPRERSLARGLHIIGRLEEGVTEVYPRTIRRIAE